MILEIIKKRRSIRKFKEKEIPKEDVEKLISALMLAPSAGNLQSRKFYFIFNKEIREKLKEAAFNQEFIAQAPLVIVALSDKRISLRYGKRGVNLYSICDVSASVENLLLVATELGLGTCWVGAFDEKRVSQILNLPPSLRPICLVPVGYPEENPSSAPRLKKEEVIKFRY